MEKILISENSEQANAFISELEGVYLTSASAVYAKIQALGLERVSKKLLFDTIRGDLNPLQAKYEEFTKLDVESFKTPAAQAQMRVVFEEKLGDIRRTVGSLFFSRKQINNRSLSEKYFEQFIEVDESGKPYISDESKTSILESFKEYIDDPKEQKMYLAQQAAAKAINDFVDALRAGGINSGIDTYVHLFFRKYFKITEKTNDRLEITAETVDFKSLRP